MPADMHQLAAKTNRDALARSSRQLDKMYRLRRGTSKLSRNHRMRASDERVYLRVEEAFLPTCYWPSCFCQTVRGYFRTFRSEYINTLVLGSTPKRRDRPTDIKDLPS
jgi:hypothetical protein